MNKVKQRVISWLLAMVMVCTMIVPADSVSAASTKGAKASTTTTYASVHDPSIIKDTKTGRYYVFGSHLAWAYSTDLQNWKTFKNNINTDYKTLFAKEFEWAAMGDTAYNPTGNMWAPDVIWNPTMKKWCMYMSINGCSWNSSIALLTADSLGGDWTYVGTVLYSGFTNANYNHDYTKTDYVKATGESTLASRYIGGAYTCKDGRTTTAATTWNTTYGAHAIDPCVFYADDGTLYMSYGSWSGGIYMIKLDASTGLRDYTKSYTYKSNTSDPYMGLKIAGGAFVSGEASYIQKIGSYYYLFVTYGGLASNGGYNMRVFRSKSVTGPYKDKKGNDARTMTYFNNINGSVGVRMMSYYKWNYMNTGYTAQGHNSAFVDSDGKAYLVYHTRTSNGSETHQLRVHQLFVTQDGWLTVAPFEYSGETLKKVTKSSVKGTYEVLFHTGTNYSGRECVQSVTLTFASNGKITGDKKGTWKWGTKGAPYVTMKIGGKTYKGVFVQQKMENEQAAGSMTQVKYKRGKSTMTFTVLGSDQTEVWGYNIKAYFSTMKPTGVVASSTSKGIKVSWFQTGNAKGYYVYRKVSGGKWKKIKTIKKATTLSYTDKTVKKGKTYTYRIRAYTASGTKSAYSASTLKVKYKKK